MGRIKPRYQRLKETGPASIPNRFVPKFYEGSDNRCSIIREIKRRIARLKEETGSESYAKELMCERAIFLAVQLETQEINALEKQTFDAGSYTQATNALSGLLSKLGLERRAAKVKTLKTYIKNGSTCQ